MIEVKVIQSLLSNFRGALKSFSPVWKKDFKSSFNEGKLSD
ncbi:MAG: hypothetical protein ACK4UV_07745 [Ignavibacterium sp.]